MAQKPYLDRRDALAIQRGIEETRAGLTDKLGTLERTLLDKVDGVARPIQHQLTAAKNLVDLKALVLAYPWMALTAAVAAGCLLGRMFSPTAPSKTSVSSTESIEPVAEGERTGDSKSKYACLGNEAKAPPVEARVESGSTSLARLIERFDPEIHKVKSLAIGVGLEIVRELIQDSVAPKLAPHVDDILASVTAKLGGTAVRGPILKRAAEEKDRNE